MSANTANKQLYDLLVTKNFNPQALDAQGKPAANPEEATLFSFDYKGESGKDYGTVVIMFNGKDMDVYFGDNLGKGMEPEDKKGWFDGFLFQIRQFAKRNVPGTFNLQDLSKLKYSMQGQAALSEGLFESWQGKKDISYNADATQARLMIKHKRNIGEGEARFRNIQSLFIETADGERFKLPFTKLSAGRAMLEHVRQGGKPYDIRGNHIATIVNEMNLLSRFRRASQSEIFEGETQQLVEQANHYYETLQNNLKTMSTSRGYSKYFESWDPAALTDEDVIIEDLRHMFIEQNIDSRIEQALPLLARLQKEEAMKEANIFEDWANLITEGTWAIPDTKEKQAQLVSLLSQELPVGPDATNATELLYDLLGDDELFDRLEALADQDANADAREIILTRLEQLKSNQAIAQVIGQLKNPAPDSQEPVQEVKDTVEKDAEGKIKSWSHEGDWEKVKKVAGKEVDPRGEVTHMSDVARRKTEKLKESAGNVMFKDQDRLDRLETLRSFAKAVGNTAKAEELDKQIRAIYAANPVGSQDKGHLEEGELTIGDTVECPGGIIGQIIADEGDRWIVRDLHSEFEDDTLEFRKSDCVPTFNETVKDPRTQTEDPPNTKQPEVTPNTLGEEETDECDSGKYRNAAHLDPINAMGQIKENLEEDNPVESAIINRIMRAHPDLLAKFGPEAIMNAAREQAEWVGDVDEIGSSDVSAWVDAIARDLNNADHDAVWDLQHGKKELDELSPATLKDYIKKASSSGEENSASNLASRAAHKLAQFPDGMLPAGVDDGSDDDHKSFMRSKGIARAVDKLEELSNDTVNSYKEKAWDEFAQGNDKRGAGIMRANAKLRGEHGHVKTTDDQLDELSPNTLKSYAKDAALDNARRGNTLGYLRGKPTKSGALEKDIGDKIARRQQGINKAINRLEESGMSEADAVIRGMMAGEIDPWDIMHHPKDKAEEYVRDLMDKEYNKIINSDEIGSLHPDDDFEAIMNIVVDHLRKMISETDAAGALSNETVGGGSWLEEGSSHQEQAIKAYNFIKDNWMDHDKLYKYAGTTLNPQAFYQAVHAYNQKHGEDVIVKALARAFDMVDTGNDSPRAARESADKLEESYYQIELYDRKGNLKAIEHRKDGGYTDEVIAKDCRSKTRDGWEVKCIKDGKPFDWKSALAVNETTALQGQYGHSGKLQAVEGLDQDMMDRIKFLAGVTK